MDRLSFSAQNEEAVQTGCFFRFALLIADSPEATPLAPFRGRGCKYKFARNRSRAVRARVSFSAQRTKDSIKLSFFCAFRGRVRDHIDNPSKPPFDKGGFAWSGKRNSPRSVPTRPFQGCFVQLKYLSHVE